MKLIKLRQLVKEELKRALRENSGLEGLTPGRYKVEFTTENRDSYDEEVVTVSQDDIDVALRFGGNENTFWGGQISNSFFGRGDKIISVEKIG